MKYKSILLIALGLICGFIQESVLQAQTVSLPTPKEKLENSILWKVEGEYLSAPSYLLGTMHLFCADEFVMPEKIKTALESVEVLALEIDFSDPEEMIAFQKAMISEEKISETYSGRDLEIITDFVTNDLGMTLEQVDNFDLSTILIMAQGMADECTEPVSYEMELMTLATTHSLDMMGLETAIEQLAMLKSATSDKEIIEQMENFDGYSDVVEVATSLYLEERLEECTSAIILESEMTEKEMDIILNKRNKNWSEVIPGQISEHSTMIAVGAAHLTGEQGLINLLRAQGYTVTAILN